MSSRKELVFARIGPHAANAILPRKGTPGAAGYDLYAAESALLIKDEGASAATKAIPTGWSVRIPPGKYLKICERSGLALKGVSVGGGIIDSDYTGEIKVILRNHASTPCAVSQGDRIAQAIVMDCHNDLVPVEADSLPTLEGDLAARGCGGFGSTGLQ